MAKQIQIIEYFSRLVHQYGSAEEIMEEITRECVSQLHFDRCEMYLLADDEQAWVQQTRMEKGAPLGKGEPTAIRCPRTKASWALSAKVAKRICLKGLNQSVGLRWHIQSNGANRVRSSVIGVIVFGIILLGVFFQPEHDDDRQNVIQHVANLFGQKLEKKISEFAQVYAKSKRRSIRRFTCKTP